MEIHRIVTQPQLVVFASSSKRIRGRKLDRTEFRFVFGKPKQFIGTEKHWVAKQDAIEVGDRERTIIDGQREPEYCGGMSEVARVLWMRRKSIQTGKIMDYVLRLGIGVVILRPGCLPELDGIAPESELAKVCKSPTATYLPLDPVLPKEGPHLKRRQILLNITPKELEAVRAS